MTRYWLGVVSAEHVRRGVQAGFAQANHGKRTVIERMQPGDGLVYYSPREAMRDGAPIRSFTAIGTVDDRPAWQARPDEPYASDCFRPWRRAVSYRRDVRDAPIDELRGRLELTARPNWGIVLRRGIVELSEHDFRLIDAGMRMGDRNDGGCDSP